MEQRQRKKSLNLKKKKKKKSLYKALEHKIKTYTFSDNIIILHT